MRSKGCLPHPSAPYNTSVLAELPFSPEQDDGFFEQLPAAAGVFVLRGEGEPYISKTANLRRRMRRLLGRPAEPSRRLNLRERVRRIEYLATGSDFESQFVLYRLLREAFPETYSARLRLRPAPLVKLHLQNEYPRASVTTRLGRITYGERNAASANDPTALEMPATGGGLNEKSGTRINLYYGPFASRASAEKFASDALDFFKMRRCVDDLHPDPAFPGCIYSEMKMCLAPCFKGCTDSEYHSEVARVQNFFESRGHSLWRELEEQREQASMELKFEEAAAIHAKVERLKPVLAQLPEIVQRVDRLDALIVQPSAETDSVCLFRFRHARMSEPLMFRIQSAGASSQAAATQSARHPTMESRVEEAIHSFPESESATAMERTEHLAILKRWYYRSQRTGEIFFSNEKGAWPLRRMVRGIGRVYRGERDQEPDTFSATQGALPSS